MTYLNPMTAAALMSCVAFSPATATELYQTGMTQLRVADEARPLEGFLWYPTEDTSATVAAHGNVVWEAIRVIPQAEMAAGERPLVLLSHGMFGNARNQAWLAQVLTAQGYIVAAIDHPGTSTFSRDPDQRRELWERPNDITRTLDHLLSMDGVGAQIDENRIYMAGHSLGGFAAVMLAGGRFDPELMDASCEAIVDDLVCGIFSDWQIAQTDADREIIAHDWSDPRIDAIAVLDLGGTQTFTPESLASIDVPMMVVAAPIANSGINLDTESRALIAALPASATYWEPEWLSHFDFLGVCTPQAMEVLLAEEPEDAFVCEEGTEERRAEHVIIAERLMNFFDAN